MKGNPIQYLARLTPLSWSSLVSIGWLSFSIYLLVDKVCIPLSYWPRLSYREYLSNPMEHQEVY